LPTVEGIKGRITGGDRTIELDNALRQPYSQRTKIFDKPMPTPRKYILTQSSKIPPRGKALRYEDFSVVANKQKKNGTSVVTTPSTKADQEQSFWSQLENLQIPCGGDTTTTLTGTTDAGILRDGEKKGDDDVDSPKAKANANITLSNGRLRDSTTAAAAATTTSSQDSDFFSSLKRQKRSVQAHVDRAMAVLGQDYATPSAYAYLGNQFGEDLLGRQDDIAANFFFVDDKEEKRGISEKARMSFLRFFLTIFARYDFFIDSKTNRLDGDRFANSLNLPTRQRNYVREVVTSQMFETFMQDTNSIRHRRLFDEYVIKYKNGNFGLDVKKKAVLSRKHKATPGTPLLDSTQWKKPKTIVPGPPCSVGLQEGLVFCKDRRFPDRLNPEECITKKTVSPWKIFWDGAFCSAFSSCI